MLSDFAMLALARAFSSRVFNQTTDKYPDGIESQPVKFTVEVEGTLQRGEDYDKRAAASIPWQQIACALMVRVSEGVLTSALEDALDGSINATSMAESHPRCAVKIAELWEESTRRTRGTVKFLGSVVEVSANPLVSTAHEQEAARR